MIFKNIEFRKIILDEKKDIYQTNDGSIYFSAYPNGEMLDIKFSQDIRDYYCVTEKKSTDCMVLRFDTGYILFFTKSNAPFKIEHLNKNLISLRSDIEPVIVEFVKSFCVDSDEDGCSNSSGVSGLVVVDTGNITVSELSLVLGSELNIPNAGIYDDCSDVENFLYKMKVVGVNPVIITKFHVDNDRQGIVRKRNGDSVAGGFYLDPINKYGAEAIKSKIKNYAKMGVVAVIYQFYSDGDDGSFYKNAVLNNGKMLLDYYLPGSLFSDGIKEISVEMKKIGCGIITNNRKCRNKDNRSIFFKIDGSYKKALNTIKCLLMRGFYELYPFFKSDDFLRDFKTLPLILLFAGYFIDDIALYDGLTSSMRIGLLDILKTRKMLDYYVAYLISVKKILNDDFLSFSDENGFFIGNYVFFGYCKKNIIDSKYFLPDGVWYSLSARAIISGGVVSICTDRKKDDLFIKRGGVLPVCRDGSFEYIVFPDDSDNEFRFSDEDYLLYSKKGCLIHIEHKYTGSCVKYTVIIGKKNIAAISLNAKEYPVVKSPDKDYFVINSSVGTNVIDISVEMAMRNKE